jgi:hypothetical protein
MPGGFMINPDQSSETMPNAFAWSFMVPAGPNPDEAHAKCVRITH